MKKIILILLSLTLFSCGSSKKSKVTLRGADAKTRAQNLYQDAERLIKKKRYLSATEKLSVIRSQYPYSYYAIPAELKMADVLFLQKNYIDSAAAYLSFKDLHPKHKQSDYITFRIAESYFKQIPKTHDRDLTATHQSLVYYKELLQKYPKSSHIKEVESRVIKCEEMIRKKEQYIADFYFRTKKYNAARYRYLDIIDSFDNKQILYHAKLRVVESSYYMKEYRECLNYLKSYAKSFDEETAEDAGPWADKCGNKIKESLVN